MDKAAPLLAHQVYLAQHRLSWPLTLAIMAAAVSAHWVLFPLITTDVVNDYVPWFNIAVKAGPVGVFAHPWGSYTPPYLYGLALLTPLKGVIPDPYIIKLLSMLGNVALAGSVWHLLRRSGVPDAGRFALCVLALPSVIFNAAMLGQCDAMVTAPLVMATAAALDRRHRAMLLWSGFAMAIKLQAILFAPFVLGVLLARRVPLRQWFLAPVAFVAPFLPAWALGWPAADLAGIYFRQAETSNALSRNAPNIWSIAQSVGIASPSLSGLIMTVAIGASATYIAYLAAAARHAAKPVLLRWALLAPLLTAGLLPRMHERYFFLADILSLCLVAVLRDGASQRIAALVQFGSTTAILAYAAGHEDLASVAAVAMIGATVAVARPLLSRPANDNPLGLAPPQPSQ